MKAKIFLREFQARIWKSLLYPGNSLTRLSSKGHKVQYSYIVYRQISHGLEQTSIESTFSNVFISYTIINTVSLVPGVPDLYQVLVLNVSHKLSVEDLPLYKLLLREGENGREEDKVHCPCS